MSPDLAPGCHQHCALEHETLAMPRLAEAAQKALKDVARQKHLEKLVALLGKIEEARPDERANVADRPTHRRSAPRDRAERGPYSA